MDCQSRVGFSLIELIVVLSLMGILFAIGIPASNKLLLSYQLNGSARRVQTDLQNIKMRAAAENLGFQFTYGAGSGSYTIRRDGAVFVSKPLPEGIVITQAGTVSFSPRGTAGSNRIRLQNRGGACKQVVVSSTGRIRVCNPAGCGEDC
ncbi:MAG TPA: GspH/FimT family pseudopilin [Candidatus Binatia bacterium]|jgi:prepilin-type N-terminal cleavage/methylation domain